MKRSLLVLFAVCLALCGCIPKGTGAPSPTEELIPLPTDDETPDAQATFHRATLYFLSDEGYIVPVTKLIPRETGIAKACLSYMQSTPVNVAAAKKQGLMTVIPEGTKISIKVADGCATVDLIELTPLSSLEEERAMLRAIVSAMTEFPTVTSVTITRDGRGGELENGAALPVQEVQAPLNPEEEEVTAMTGAVPCTLYFPNRSGALTVPVTRYMSGQPTVYAVVSALIEGAKGSGLMNCFPEGTLLLGASIENGRAMIDLSEDFRTIAETDGAFSLCFRTLWLTLAEHFDFSELHIMINGEDFEPEPVSPPNAVNSME